MRHIVGDGLDSLPERFRRMSQRLREAHAEIERLRAALRREPKP